MSLCTYTEHYPCSCCLQPRRLLQFFEEGLAGSYFVVAREERLLHPRWQREPFGSHCILRLYLRGRGVPSQLVLLPSRGPSGLGHVPLATVEEALERSWGWSEAGEEEWADCGGPWRRRVSLPLHSNGTHGTCPSSQTAPWTTLNWTIERDFNIIPSSIFYFVSLFNCSSLQLKMFWSVFFFKYKATNVERTN